MDKIWWNELWLGYPVGDQYKEGSNVENAHLLSRPLMLVVGELDDNVDPASTMQVVNALIKANKDFELVVIPGAHHTMGEDFGEHKRYDFFVRHLMQVNPPKWDEINRRSEVCSCRSLSVMINRGGSVMEDKSIALLFM